MDSAPLTPLLDLNVDVEARLQGPVVRVSQLLSLKAGSLIGTVRPARKRVDLFAGNTNIGSGKLIIAHGRGAVRMNTIGKSAPWSQ